MTAHGVVCLGLVLIAASAGGVTQDPPRPTAEVLIPVPELRPFVIALDEIELDWTARKGRTDSRPAMTPVAGATVVSDEPQRTRVRVDAAPTVEALAHVLAANQAANPGARGELVVYEKGRPRTEASRQLVTSDVALMLNEGASLDQILSRAKVADAKTVRGTPSGYVIGCDTPFTAIEVARALATIDGVKRAYPLLKRSRVTR